MGWCRWYDDVLGDLKFGAIASDTGLPYAQVVGAWSLVLALANASPVRGRLMLAGHKKMTPRNVAETLHLTVSETETLFHALREYEMLSTDPEGYDYVTNWDKRQFESDTSTERVRKHREMKRARNVSVTDQTRPDHTHTQTSSTPVRVVTSEPAEDDDAPTLIDLLNRVMPGQLNRTLTDWLEDLVTQNGEPNVRRALKECAIRAASGEVKSRKGFIEKCAANPDMRAKGKPEPEDPMRARHAAALAQWKSQKAGAEA